ncbi:MAG: hypothetical protein SFY81_06375 [Verrucomicrobiota bacterium]|nr:hypothetical protein [Verrucomicrobiota bacterium]
MRKAEPKKKSATQPREGKTNLPGQNPRQNDSPDHDEHNDQNRINQYDAVREQNN